MEFVIFTDGGARGNPGISGCGVSIQDSQGKEIEKISKFIGLATNNEAEYKAVSLACDWLKHQALSGDIKISFKLDSLLVVQQLSKNWKIKEPRLLVFAQEIWEKLSTLPQPVIFNHIPRSQNARADQLANEAMDQGTMSH